MSNGTTPSKGAPTSSTLSRLWSVRRLLLALAGVLLLGSTGLLYASPVLATTTLAPAALVRHEQSDPRFTYAGAWTTTGANINVDAFDVTKTLN